jgi:hypothetical protein
MVLLRRLLKGVGESLLWVACDYFLRLYTFVLQLRLTFCKLMASVLVEPDWTPERCRYEHRKCN